MFYVFKGCLSFKFFRFSSFNLQMPDTNYDPQAQMKSKVKSSEQRFGHVNVTNRNS